MSFNSNTLIEKLVRKNLSFLRIITFCFFSIIGFFILLLAGTIYLDYAKNFGEDSSVWKANYIVLNKKISSLQTLTGEKPSFNEDEIEKLKSQNFTAKVGTFKSSQFPVKLQVGGIAGIRGFSTDLFFESVPKDFIEVDQSDWKWQEGQDFIPIIIPKSYLNLYNFGFATSQGLPQVSESLFTKIPFQLIIGKDENQKIYQARIVDFTTKINTILVPENFLEWANQTYASQKTAQPSRLVVETKSQGDENASIYFEQHNYDINKDELKNNELTYYLKLAFSLVLFIGLIIVFAAIWLMIINFQLMIEKNKHKTKDLFLIGYNINQLARPYLKFSIIFMLVSYIISIPLVYFVLNIIKEKVGKFMTIESSHVWEVIGFGLIIVLFLFILNKIILTQSIKKIALKE
ncbi:FtsX-like permease family protein [Empedobacter stercoris]|uniref:FtsX-like permease family protein n=1 Tax=Empedobacter stercoris TaxID=1628248 RepID=UPI001CE1A342|nr:ABC transporter permease [Empedobacter stercoris]MCA4777770.1 ABC transporter permease [Empedobacter stercoris]